MTHAIENHSAEMSFKFLSFPEEIRLRIHIA